MSNLDSHFSNASTGSLKLQQLDYNVYKVLSALTPPRNSFVLLNNFLSILFTSRTPLLSNQHNIYLPTFSGFKYYLNCFQTCWNGAQSLFQFQSIKLCKHSEASMVMTL